MPSIALGGGIAISISAPSIPTVTIEPPNPLVLVVPVGGPPGDDSTVPGPDGDDAFEVAVSEGFVGTRVEWLASLIGPEGPVSTTPGPAGPSYEPPFIFIQATQGVAQFGNGVNGRIPAVSANAGTTGYAYFNGVSGPWPNVDVYLAWVEGASIAPGNVVFNTYLSTFGNGEQFNRSFTGEVTYTAANVQYRYHEDLMVANYAVTPNVMLSSSISRDGNDVADTCTAAVGIVGLVLRKATP